MRWSLLLRAALVAPLALLLAATSSGCAVVPQNRRAKLAEPAMQANDDLNAHRKRKLYTTREAAAGGDGKTAGGGCSCQ